MTNRNIIDIIFTMSSQGTNLIKKDMKALGASLDTLTAGEQKNNSIIDEMTNRQNLYNEATRVSNTIKQSAILNTTKEGRAYKDASINLLNQLGIAGKSAEEIKSANELKARSIAQIDKIQKKYSGDQAVWADKDIDSVQKSLVSIRKQDATIQKHSEILSTSSKEIGKLTRIREVANAQVKGTLPTNQSVKESIANINKEAQMSGNYEKAWAQSTKLRGDVQQSGVKIAASYKRQLEEMVSPGALLNKQIAESTRLDSEYGKTRGRTQQTLEKFAIAEQRGVKLDEQQIATKKKLKEQYSSFGKTQIDEIKRMALWAIGWNLMYGSIRMVQNVLMGIPRTIVQFDQSMTELAAVTFTTKDSLNGLAHAAINMAIQYGVSLNSVTQGMVLWARQGKTASEIGQLMNASLLMSNVAGMQASESTDFLTAALNQFNLAADKSIRLVDTLTALDAAYAASIPEIVQGVKVVGQTASEIGLDFNETSAIITALVSKTRLGGAQMGNALKMIFTRIYRPQTLEDLQVMGKVVGYTNTGYRDMMSILGELSGKWGKLSEIEKRSLAERIAGVRQVNVFLSLMDTWPKVVEGVTIAEDAMGTSAVRNGIIMSSIAKQTEQAKARFEALSVALGKGGLQTALLGVIQVGNGVLGVLNKFSIATSSVVIVAGLTASVIGLAWAFKILKTELKSVALVQSMLSKSWVGLALVGAAIGVDVILHAFQNKQLSDSQEEYIISLDNTKKKLLEYQAAQDSGKLSAIEQYENNKKISSIIKQLNKDYKGQFDGITSLTGALKRLDEVQIKQMDNEKTRIEGLRTRQAEIEARVKVLMPQKTAVAPSLFQVLTLDVTGDEFLKQKAMSAELDKITEQYRNNAIDIKTYDDAMTKATKPVEIQVSAVVALERSIKDAKLTMADYNNQEKINSNLLDISNSQYEDKIVNLIGLSKEMATWRREQDKANKGIVYETDMQRKYQKQIDEQISRRKDLADQVDNCSLATEDYWKILAKAADTDATDTDAIALKDATIKQLNDDIRNSAKVQQDYVEKQSEGNKKLAEYIVIQKTMNPLIKNTTNAVHDMVEAFMSMGNVSQINSIVMDFLKAIQKQAIETAIGIKTIEKVIEGVGSAVGGWISGGVETIGINTSGSGETEWDDIGDKFGLEDSDEASFEMLDAVKIQKWATGIGFAITEGFILSSTYLNAGGKIGGTIGTAIGATAGQWAATKIFKEGAVDLGSQIGNAIFPVVGQIFGTWIGSLIGQKLGKDEVASEVGIKEITGATNNVTTELQVTNRILLDIKRGIETNPLPESFYFRNIPKFANGGVVPGPVGRPTLAIVHGQETINKAGQGNGGYIGNLTIHVNGGNSQDVISAIQDAFYIDSTRGYIGT